MFPLSPGLPNPRPIPRPAGPYAAVVVHEPDSCDEVYVVCADTAGSLPHAVPLSQA